MVEQSIEAALVVSSSLISSNIYVCAIPPKSLSSPKYVFLIAPSDKLLLFTIGVMKLVDMFPLGWNGLNTMQVQILPPINKINRNLKRIVLNLTLLNPYFIYIYML